MKGLGTRVISGVVLLALVLTAIWLQGLLLMFVVALASGLAAHEFYEIARRAGYAPWYPASIALSLLLAMRGYLGGKDLLAGVPYIGPGTGVEITVLAIVLVLVLVRQGAIWLRAPVAAGRSTLTTTSSSVNEYATAPGWANLGLTLGGAIYTGGLLGYVPMLAALQDGPGRAAGMFWLLAVIACTAACDTGAYFVGSLFGSHKLIPHISPAKTWEGLAGGTLGTVIASIVLSGLLKLSLIPAVILGLVICAAAVAGDLCESLLKRAARVKDSGHLIPGHGGILDRVDSIVFVLVAVYWFTQVVIG
ncbi:MAG TPA: CDP-archaeol synthase [Chloroflexia bacterium]|nr:CDP-archaeol synthase [Chloroflexia bacterium]